MCRRDSVFVFMTCLCLSLSGTGWADVPPPPANQSIGMPDVAFADQTEADCRMCHSSGVPDRHHVKYDEAIDSSGTTAVPYPDTDGDGNRDTVYSCLSCHGVSFSVVRDCLACHTGSSPHHNESSSCTSCHGDIVDDPDDGHYVPSYSPSFVTPAPSSTGGSAGACNYCHDASTAAGILSNKDLHHGTGLEDCDMCHDFSLPEEEQIRMCEKCHGPDSLHNIQADSPAPGSIGTIVVGGEDAGYGHVGRDAGPGDSDCWGCHGFAKADLSLISGPIASTLYDVRPAVVKAGTNALLTLSGSAFTNTTGEKQYPSTVILSAPDGSSTALLPGFIVEGLIKVTVPAEFAPGNYKVRAVKTDDDQKPVKSNAVGITIVREVEISGVTADGTVTIEGSGFGSYAPDTRISVTGKVALGQEGDSSTVEASIVDWSDTVIQVEFDAIPSEITVNSIFGTATSGVK